MSDGDRVQISAVRTEDSPILFRWANDVGIAHMNGPFRPTDWPSHNDWFLGLSHDAAKVVFAIRMKEDGRLIGYVQLSGIHPVFRSADLGIVIGEEEDRSKGYGQEALRQMLDFAWTDLNLNRIGLFVFGRNERAITAYQRVGFELEGVLRRAAYVDGAYVDITVMGVLNPAVTLGYTDRDKGDTGPS